MIVNPWPGFRHEDRPLITYLDRWDYINLWSYRIGRRVLIAATRLQWLYLTGAKFSDCYKWVVIIIEFILAVNIFIVSGLRARDPPRKIQLNSRQHKCK